MLSGLTPLRTIELQWLSLAVLGGVLASILPVSLSVFLLAMVVFVLVALIEPALAFVAMLVVAPLKTLIETESAMMLPVDAGQALLVFALAVWAMSRIAPRQRFLGLNTIPVLWPILAFVGGALLTLPNAYAVGTGLSEWLKWVEIALLVYVVASFAEGRWQWLVFGVVLAGAIQALVGIYQFQGGSGAPHLWILDFEFFRAFGSFGQPNPFGAFMGLTLPLALGMTWGYALAAWESRQQPLARNPLLVVALVYTLLASVILVGLLISWSRGAWIGFGAAAVILLWLAPPRLWQGTLLVASLLGIFLILWGSGLLPAQLVQRITDFQQDFTGFRDMRGVEISDENYAVVERLAHWQSALDMAAQRPWLGVGFGNYEAAYADFALANWPLALGHAHNYYLNLLAETGVVGLTLYVMMWVAIIWMTSRLARAGTWVERGAALGLMGVWTHLTIHSLVDKLYVSNIFLHIGVMLGVLAVLQVRAREKEARGRSWSKRTHRAQAM